MEKINRQCRDVLAFLGEFQGEAWSGKNSVKSEFIKRKPEVPH